MKKSLVFIGAAVRSVGSGCSSCGTGLVKCAGWVAAILSASFLYAAPVAAVDMTAEEVLANGCSTTPDNFPLSDFWETKMGVLEAWCNYPSIIESDIRGRRKPQAFVNGSAGSSHDVYAVKILNGTGESSDVLGVAPRTAATFGPFCADPGPLLNAKQGDLAFSLLRWSDNCRITSPLLPTIPVFGGVDGNNDTFIGDVKAAHGIHISSGGNYGKAIDYFTPGGGSTIVGGGNVSFALPEFAGIIAALNAALVSENRAILTNDTIKAVLNASSDEVYLEINGARGIYPESQSCVRPSCKYYGQIVNLSNAIGYALANSPELTLLTLIKDVNNNNGGNDIASDFDLRVTGGIYDGSIARYSGEWLEIVNSVTYTLSENSPGYQQVGDVICTDDENGADLGHPVTLSAGQSATCTMSNDDIAPEITIIKHVTNDNGGDADAAHFDLHMAGGTLTGSTYDGSEVFQSGARPTVESNTVYTLSETTLAGYEQTGITCTDDIDGVTEVDHPLTLAEGQLVTCTILNDDIEPGLTIIKEVSNDNGGDAVATNFDLHLAGGTLPSSTYSGSEVFKSGAKPTVEANAPYTLSESTIAGYEQTGITCTDDKDDVTEVDQPLILAEGQFVTCTILNDDIEPGLTIIKDVTNDNGGGAEAAHFDLHLAGGTLPSSTYDGTEVFKSGAKPTVEANTSYTLSETALKGYEQTGITCTDDKDDVTEVDQPLTLAEEQFVTCTIFNNDYAPGIRIIKNVIGGNKVATDFTLYLSELGVDPDAGRESGQLIQVNADTPYILSEDQLEGYVQIGIVCIDNFTRENLGHPVSLSDIEQSVTCTISNIDKVLDSTPFVIPLPSGGVVVIYL